jgi:hypothetical protein
MANELVEFYERTFIEQHLDAFASGLFAFGMLLLNGSLAASVHSFVIAVLEVLKFAGCG